MKNTKIKKGNGKEKPAEWYNQHYKLSKAYKSLPEDIFYFPIWEHAITWIGNEKIIDLGCGSGQFSKMLIDRNKKLILKMKYAIEHKEDIGKAVYEKSKFYSVEESSERFKNIINSIL